MRAEPLQSGAASSDQLVVCKRCLSRNVVRNGRREPVQYYLCRSCGLAFAGTDAPPGMRYSAQRIAAALSMFYDGLSIDGIRGRLAALEGIHPSDSTVYGWVMLFTGCGAREAEASSVEVGDLWVAVDSAVVEGMDLWAMDIVDSATRFLLACRISRGRTRPDTQRLMMEAVLAANSLPRVIVADGLGPYLDPGELENGVALGRTECDGWSVQPNSNLTASLRETLLHRSTLLGRMKNEDTMRLVAEGWRVDYNFFRDQAALDGKTPGQAARTTVRHRSWEDVVRCGGRGGPLNGTSG